MGTADAHPSCAGAGLRATGSGPERIAGAAVSRTLLEALRVSRGHRSQAAELLGISRATFYRRLNELGIDNKAIREHLNITKGS